MDSTVTTFRITVRGQNTELRGFHREEPGTETLGPLSQAMVPYGMVIASHAENDYDPFAISDPDNPPTHEKSKELITAWFEQARDSQDELIEWLAHIHFNQANVIRGERHQREQAEAELRDRELHHFETEEALAKVKALVQPPHSGDLSQAIWQAVSNV